MELSQRLMKIAQQIEIGETMADIGTDHGFLPIYLAKEGISPKVILTDISPGSAEKAREDCLRLDPEGEYDVRQGDGLQVLERAEVHTVVIAGMGGITISHILERDPDLTASFKKYVLQPRRHVGYMRHRLAEMGFVIDREHLVREGKYICEIIVCHPEGASEEVLPFEGHEEIYSYPDDIALWDRDLGVEYLMTERQKVQTIMESIENQEDERMELMRRYIARIDLLLEEER